MDYEMIEIVNENGEVTGSAPRDVVHNDNTLLHRVVHLLLFNHTGQLLLQKRSLSKDIAPGTWDTSVGGHVHPGEDIREALSRETEEELMIREIDAEYLYSYIHRNAKESELVYSFRSWYKRKVQYNKNEISEVKFWDLNVITDYLDTDIFSNNFRDEFRRYMGFMKHKKR